MYAHSRAKHTDPKEHRGRHHDAGVQEYWYLSRGEYFSNKSQTVYCFSFLLCSWMMSLTLVMRTRTGLRRQDTELSGGWTGELFSEVLIIALVCKVNFFTRCLSAHPRPDLQNLFPIVQGGLEEEKRKDCADQVFFLLVCLL